MSKRPRKDKCIEVLLKEIRRGVTHSKCFAELSGKWHYPKRTFENHWSEAQEIYNKERREINDEVMRASTEKEKESAKRNIMTRLDILENLTKIALGYHVRVGAGEQFTPTAGEQIRAMETINRMQGYNEADKLEVTEIKPILTKRMSKK